MMIENVSAVLSIMGTGCVITLKTREGCITSSASTLSNQKFIHHNIYVFFPLKEGINSEVTIPAVA